MKQCPQTLTNSNGVQEMKKLTPNQRLIVKHYQGFIRLDKKCGTRSNAIACLLDYVSKIK